MNSQPKSPREYSPDGELAVHSIFATIQAEGPYAGHAAIFIRLHGCNLQCPGCDTDYTSVYMLDTPEEIITSIHATFLPHKLVVITGGEPFRQNVTPLVLLLLNAQYTVQIETNGVFWPGDDFPWNCVTVVCSPKTGKIHPETAKHVHAFKYVLSHSDVLSDGLPGQALGHPLGDTLCVARPPASRNVPIYLQPMDAKDPAENERNLLATVASVLDHRRYIMGIQFNKLLGLP